MEEGLLQRSTIVEARPNGNVEDMPPSGASATTFLLLSTGVALCGSLSTGCAVSTISHLLRMGSALWNIGHNMDITRVLK